MLYNLFEKFNIESHSINLNKGDEVFHLGQETRCIYRVTYGHVQLFRDDFEGNRIMLHQAFSDQFFAEASINAKQYHCTALCLSDTELQAINIEHFKKLLNSPDFSAAWINHLSSELRRQRARAERLNLKTAVEKITHYILTEGNGRGELVINNSLTEVAQIIGLSRESLYRTLSKMKKNKQLQQSKEHLRLL